MTLPPCYSWSPLGTPVSVAYEAPQGRRVNALGAYFSHGPQAGRFVHEVYANLPKSQAKKQPKTPEQIARDHGLWEAEVGPIDSGRLLRFVWREAGRPAVYLSGWRRERPLVLDNYSVHSSQPVQEALPPLAAAAVFLFYLPCYSPELSQIEPICNSVKHHEMPVRSYTVAGDLKRAVEEALARKAQSLLAERLQETQKTTNQLCAAT